MPPYLSSGARHTISRMLTVDSNSRAKLSEIRASPWFQQDLPAYLATPARRRHHEDSDDDTEAASPTSPTPEAPPPEGTEFVEGFGWVEYAVVEDLAKRVPDLHPEQLMAIIRSGHDRYMRVGYQLCRDHRRPEHLRARNFSPHRYIAQSSYRLRRQRQSLAGARAGHDSAGADFSPFACPLLR
jgi:carbon catabolite-derepressing protein kinase